VQLGLVGLGKMGGPMARRLAEAGHEVIGCDREQAAIERARDAGVKAVGDVAGLVGALPAPRVVWLTRISV
jgi:6-phosphogluconate dehydrogenase